VPPDALVLAGGSPDPTLTGATLPKAFTPLRGRAMVEYVLAALRVTPRIGRIAIAGPASLPPQIAASIDVFARCDAGGGDLLANVFAGLEALDHDAPVLIVAADIPLLTPRALDAFLDRAEGLDADVVYGIVPREDMVRAFPGAHKTFVRLRDGTFTGGSVVWARPRALAGSRSVLQQAVEARKRPWSLAGLFGPGVLLGLATGRLRIADLEAHVARITGLRARAVICHHPEIGLDVDGSETLAVVRQRLDEQAGHAAVNA
jgi:GTP:adenosylcobinamide-phosphate guanylyltransferase